MAYRPTKSSRVPEYGSMSIFNRDDQVCTTCLDLNLRNQISTFVRVSYFEAVESALIGCRFCSLVCQGLNTLGGRVSEHFSIVTIFARNGKPFYISWDDQSSGRTAIELFTSPGNSPHILIFAYHLSTWREMKAVLLSIIGRYNYLDTGAWSRQ
jgi:hypothetical protein